MSFDPHNHPAILRSLYQEILIQQEKYTTVFSLLAAFSQRLHEGIQAQMPEVAFEIRTFHPAFEGKKDEEVLEHLDALNQKDCQWIIAREYGFENWEQVIEEGKGTYDFTIERAIDAL